MDEITVNDYLSQNKVDLGRYKKGQEALKKLKHNVEIIGSKYFLDLDELPIQVGKGEKIEIWKMAAMMLGYSMRSNLLLFGEPGWAKTTAASLVSCACSGFPMDLYRKSLIHGHPDQSEEKMVARPHYGELMGQKEKVVWQKSLFFPAIILDEFNRLPEGKQSELLDQIDTALFSYLNGLFDMGPKSFFATVNYNDGGNNEIIPPNLDRFAMSLEFNCPGGLYNRLTKTFSSDAKIDMALPEESKKILSIIEDNGRSIEDMNHEIEKIRKITCDKLSKSTGLEFLTDEEYGAIRFAIANIPYDDELGNIDSTEATLFLAAITDDFNFTPSYGRKRSCDQIDDDNHAKDLASHNITNGLSFRAINSIDDYARAVALYLGHNVVSKAHIEAVAPYCIAHRIKASSDYESELNTKTREESQKLFAARQLIQGVSTNFISAIEDYRVLGTFIDLAKSAKAKKEMTDEQLVSHVLGSSDFKKFAGRFGEIMDSYATSGLDHPLMKEYCNFIAKNYPRSAKR